MLSIEGQESRRGASIGRLAVVLAFVTYAVSPAVAQTTRFRVDRLSLEDGLSQSSVRDLLQDAQGYLWVGTEGGLNRYDGYDFTVFRPVPGDSTSISHPYVRNLFEDRNGDLWIGTQVGLNRFNRKTGTFTRFRHDPADPHSLSHDSVWQTYEDRDGVLWVTTSGGLDRYHPETNAFERYTTGEDNPAFWLHQDASGSYWLATWQGLKRFDPATGGMRDALGIDVPVRIVAEDGDGALWVGTVSSGLIRIGASRGHRTLYRHDPGDANSIIGDAVWDVLEDHQGNLWVATSDGLDRYVPEIDGFQHHGHCPYDRTSLSRSHVRSLLEDRNGNLWIGTYQGGLNKRTARSSFVDHYRASTCDTARRLDGNDVWSIAADTAGTVWLGTNAALVRLDPSDGTTHNFRYERDGTTIWSIQPDADGTLWLGTGIGLARFDPSTNTFSDHSHTLPSRLVTTLFQDHEHRLWVGTWAGFGTFDRRTNRFSAALAARDQIRVILEDRRGVLWVGTWLTGLIAYQPEDSTATRYRTQTGSLSDNTVLALHEDRNGILWIGTGRGLNRLDATTGERTVFIQRNAGLSGDVIYGILEDDGGRLWLSTNYGLTRFDPQRHDAVVFTTTDGLQSDEFNGGAAFRDAQGLFYLGGVNGLNIFHPDSLARVRSLPPPVVLTQFEVFNEVAPLDTAIAYKDHITLAHDRNYFGFTFAALDFTRPRRNTYRYVLDGVDADWVAAGQRRYASYQNVPPGRYVFRVRAAGSGGVWNDEGVALRIDVQPPFWRTPWAYAAYGLFVAVALAGAWRLRERRRTEKRRTERYEDQRRFFANVSHELRTPLTLIVGPLKGILDGRFGRLPSHITRQHELMLRSGQRLSRLIDQLLDLARLDAGRLHVKLRVHDLGAFVRRIVETFAPLAQAQSVTLQTELPDDVVPVSFDAEAMEKVIGNLLLNAFEATPQGGSVTVACHHLTRDEPFAEVTVNDNGAGIPSDRLRHVFERFFHEKAGGSGIGLALARELVVLHHGAISVESREGDGATFKVRLPALPRGTPVGPWRAEEEGGIVSTAAVPGVTPQAQSHQQPSQESRDEAEADRTTVLIVDDHADLRAFVRAMLEPDYRVIEAQDGQEGLVAAREMLPDLIIADVMMPFVDGFALSQAVHDDAATAGVPVILLTARATPEDERAGLATGAVAYVTKPFDYRALRTRVDNLIALRRRLRGMPPPEALPATGNEGSAFAGRARKIVEAHLDDTTFRVNDLAGAMGLSYSRLHARFSDELDTTPGQFIRTVRLEHGARLLREGAGNVSEVAYAVGFSALSHFSRTFKEHFGVPPSKYASGDQGNRSLH